MKMRPLISVGYIAALFSISAPAQNAFAQAVSTKNQAKAARPTAKTPLKYGAYDSYFESSQTGVKSRASYLAFASRREFDQVFGAAAVMGKNKFLLDSAWKSGVVVAVVKRGNAIWNYRVQRVVARPNSVALHYSAKSVQIGGANRFASPLIVSVDTKNHPTIYFVENGKTVGKAMLKPQKMKQVARLLKPIPQKMKALPIINLKANRATSSGARDDFFEGTYRVGSTNCQVNPSKMAFEVKWSNRPTAQLFFFSSAPKNARNQRIYQAEESGGSARFIFDRANFASGEFVRADGKTFSIRKISKARAATRTISVYLVALGDGGKIGKNLGCGDSLVAVRRSVSTLESPLKAALQELIALPPQYPKRYANNLRLQNFWKGRDLQLQTVSVRGGTARIQIAGEVFVGGICDAPRILQQIETTARQFPSVKRVKVFVGGKSLQSILRG